MRITTNFIAIYFVAALHSVSLAGEVKGSFQDTDGNVLKKFVILDLDTAKKPELAAIFPKNCQPPLSYTKDGKFYCSKGTGPHQLMTSSAKGRTVLIEKLVRAELIIEK